MKYLHKYKHVALLLSILTFGISNCFSCPVISMSATHINCFGGLNGTASARISGGATPYTYNWSNGESGKLNSQNQTVTISGLPAGIYTIYVKDINGCTSVNLITVTQPNQLKSSTESKDANCYAESSGQVDLTVEGGTEPYSYNWTNGSSSEDLSGLVAGEYIVTITDANLCSIKDTGIVGQPYEALQSTVSFTNVGCAGGSDGTASLVVWGATPPYNYNWNAGTYFSKDISNLAAGDYDVVITDKNGCTANNSASISEPSSLSLSLTGNDVKCFGDASGTIFSTASGGTKPYKYQWRNSSYTLGSTADLSNIEAENYTLTLTDANECTISKSINISQPPALSNSISGTNILCYGQSTGEIDLSITGGSPPYIYKWSNESGVLSQTSQDLIGIAAGNYSVIITDNNDCESSAAIAISQPEKAVQFSIVATNILCYGNNTGAADLSIEGGSPPYITSWSNGQITEDIENLFAGNYSVTITDANGCSNITSIDIEEPAMPLSKSKTITDVSCYNYSDGNININISGGTKPYSYHWRNSKYALSNTTSELTNILAEIYYLEVIDAHDCIIKDTAIVNQPDLLSGELRGTNILCFGESTGAIDLTMQGGTLPYSFSWSNGDVSEDINNIPIGKYLVTVTDGHNCTYVDSTELFEPEKQLFSYYQTENNKCAGGNTGSILYNIEGGTLPYTYQWSNSSNLRNQYELLAGDYSIIVTDGHSCKHYDTISITEPDLININNSTTNVSCNGFSDGAIDITVTGGTANILGYKYTWTNSKYLLSSSEEDIDSLPAEIYTIKVVDENGCKNSAAFEIKQPETLTMQGDANGITCAGGSDGSISLTVSGGTPDYTYNWSTGETAADLTDVPIGIYTVTITDAHNCSIKDSFTLLEPNPVEISYDVVAVSCIDQSDGQIYVDATGGMGGFSYLWSNNSTDNNLIDLAGGEYSVTVTDIVGCQAEETIIVPVLDVDCISIPNIFSPNGDGINDVWNIENMFLYPECSVMVFNESGNIVYESNGYPDAWNGKRNNKDLPSGTYFYIIKTGKDKGSYTGSITIVR